MMFSIRWWAMTFLSYGAYRWLEVLHPDKSMWEMVLIFFILNISFLLGMWEGDVRTKIMIKEG